MASYMSQGEVTIMPSGRWCFPGGGLVATRASLGRQVRFSGEQAEVERGERPRATRRAWQEEGGRVEGS
ncbi:TPA: hypothetical protein DCY65_01310 [Candidatus Acetothermia bacterium]|nr:hypothetical protein [Candidatus Acetothermia bacterium]